MLSYYPKGYCLLWEKIKCFPPAQSLPLPALIWRLEWVKSIPKPTQHMEGKKFRELLLSEWHKCHSTCVESKCVWLDRRKLGMVDQPPDSHYGSKDASESPGNPVRDGHLWERERSRGRLSSTQQSSGASNRDIEHWPSDQKVPSCNLIISTVSRLKFKLRAAIWRPSGQGLTESPVIRNASYYHNPKSYLNSSLMWLWFPRTICCYCCSARMWVEATNQSCFSWYQRGGS